MHPRYSFSLILLRRHQIQSLGHVHKKEMEHIKDMLNFPEMLLLQSPPNLLEGNRVSTSEQQPSDPKTADKVSFQVIGHVSTWFSEKRATPRQPGICKSSRGKLELSKDLFTNPEHSLEGLASFSHLWHVFILNIYKALNLTLYFQVDILFPQKCCSTLKSQGCSSKTEW
jgi:hypothetical protein